MSSGTGPGQDQRPSAWLRRRVVADRIVAAVLAVVLAPVMGALGLLIRRHDGGPALIRVPRVGRHGQVFGMWKLRSMRAETDSGLATGTALTASADDRITPVGRRIRALHLDELPQLLNVAAGQMCLLGPRPEAPDFVDAEDPAWRAVLAVPPGIAGPTQLVVGDWELTRIDLDTDGTAYRDVVLPVKLAVDAWYVRSAGPAVDLGVLGSLLERVAAGREPRWLNRTVREAVPEARLIDAAAKAPGSER